jgi:WD40 repeat protein
MFQSGRSENLATMKPHPRSINDGTTHPINKNHPRPIIYLPAGCDAGSCTPGSAVPPTAVPASTAKPTPASTVTPIPTSTFTPVPIVTSTPTPRPIVECVNCQIIYTSNAKGIFQIYKMGEDGSNPVNITPPDKGHAYNFALSPDGTRIAFVANRSGSSDLDNEIYVMNADGSHVVNLTQNQVYDSSPVWSPDGTLIAFISRSEDIHDKDRYLYVMNADGSNRTRVGERLVDTPPAWSPDSSKIVFLSRMSGDEEVMTLNIINADGSYFGETVSI